MRCDRYADVDLLILYDPAFCHPERAHTEHRSFVDAVTQMVGAPVHLCLLSYGEEKESGFIFRVGAVLVRMGLSN